MESLNGNAPRLQGNTSEHHHIRLACQACQRKKIKCDRNFPCGQCTRSSLQCVASTRKPRTRHAGKRAIDSELRSRISKLESLVESLSGDPADPDGTPESEEDGTQAERTESSPAVGKYIGSPFWSSLTTEVAALREALEEEEEADDDEAISPSTSSSQQNASEYDLILCSPGSIYVMPGVLPEPTPELSAHLCNTFCENVDRPFKVLYSPALRNFMQGGKTYLGHDHFSPCGKAVKAVVWFSAVNSMSDPECQKLFGRSRNDQLQIFRRHVEVAMAQADLVNTSDIALLQAFVMFVGAARLSDTSRRTWTLTALLVRIGRGMGLHRENVSRSPFETEIRRRLWHHIRFLDAFGSLDRGSELLIDIDSYDTPLPSNVNDAEFDEHSTSIHAHTTGLTDMSLALMAYQACTLTHRLVTPESKPGGDGWQQRLEHAQQFRKSIMDKYLRHCNSTDPYERMVRMIGDCMATGMMLRAVRPMQRHVSSIPPPVGGPFVLQMAVDCLRVSDVCQSDPETQHWRWMFWVPWHALATALAGLCSIRETELANAAWPLVERSYDRAARHVADTRHGMLWRPIEKLHKKASAFRDYGSTATPPSRMNSLSAQSVQSSVAASQNPPFANIDASMASPLPTTTRTLSNPSYPPTALNHNSLPHGSMPTGGLMDSMSMDYLDSDPASFAGPLMSGPMDLGNADMSWADFERILEDISHPVDPSLVGAYAPAAATDIDVGGVDGLTLGDLQWSRNVPPGQDWDAPLHQELM